MTTRRETKMPKPVVLSAAIFLAGGAVLFVALSPAAAAAESNSAACPAGDAASWTDCRGTRAYSDGGTYVGEFRDGKPNGQGTLTYRYDGEYVGEFRDGRPSGQGTYSYPDGRKYVGEWRNGDFNGHGVRTFPDGRKEVGEWSGGKLIGAAAESAEFPAPVALLLLGIALAFVLLLRIVAKKAEPQPAADTFLAETAEAQTKYDAADRALLQAVEDLNVSDVALLASRAEARRAFNELRTLERKAATRRFVKSLKFW